MAWAEYDHLVREQWSSLLDSNPPETQVQAFLEQHPSMVPGAHLGLGHLGASGHSPFLSALITQPKLQGLGVRVPDFLWMAKDSLHFNPVFVEIEAPGKRWMTTRGHQHHDLTQALHQLDEWEDWFRTPANQAVFLDTFKVPADLRDRRWAPVFVLIYGRRENESDGVEALRTRLLSRHRFVIPYEHLKPDPHCSDYLCVRVRKGRLTALTVPPTARLAPMWAEDWARVDGKPEAAEATAGMPDGRAAFLASRFEYWDAWAAGGGRGLMDLADQE
jgi:hypothetical protein